MSTRPLHFGLIISPLVLLAVPQPAAAQGPTGPATASACYPACQAGFVCVEARCISACNPPCPANQMCTADAECVPIPAAPAPPQQSPYSPYPQPYPQYPQPYPQPYSPPSPYAPPPGNYGYPSPYAPPPGNYGYPYYGAPLAAPPEPDLPRPGDRNHDGLYLRMGLGLGGRVGTLSELVMLTELALGYTIAERLVLAAGFYGSTGMNDAKVTIAGSNVDTAAIAAITYAGCLDFYVDPHKGLHFELLAGMAQIRINERQPSFPSTRTGYGPGGGVGGGYEWWVSRNWSLGVLGRITYAQAAIPLDATVQDASSIDLHLLSIGAMFAATYQ